MIARQWALISRVHAEDRVRRTTGAMLCLTQHGALARGDSPLSA